MATKFADFLTEKKIDTRRVIAASRTLEKLRVEDRKTRLATAWARKPAPAPNTTPAGEPTTPRRGRPVTQRAIDAATVGKTVSGPTKTRILRAINRVLEQKKLEKVELVALFDPTPGKPKKPKASE